MIVAIILQIAALIMAVVIHEYGHGKVAEFLGDFTAKQQGRLSLNPIVHIDPFGSILLPLLLIASGSSIIFGMAKPVPVNPAYFSEPKKGMMYVGLAGPGSNLLLAAIAGFILRTNIFLFLPLIPTFMLYLVLINVVLAIFNLIPIPPLDGSRIVIALIPNHMLPKYAAMERYGILIIFLILIFFNSFFWSVIGPITNFLVRIFIGRGYI